MGSNGADLLLQMQQRSENGASQSDLLPSCHRSQGKEQESAGERVGPYRVFANQSFFGKNYSETVGKHGWYSNCLGRLSTTIAQAAAAAAGAGAAAKANQRALRWRPATVTDLRLLRTTSNLNTA